MRPVRQPIEKDWQLTRIKYDINKIVRDFDRALTYLTYQNVDTHKLKRELVVLAKNCEHAIQEKLNNE